jgi:hypothetical protein
MRWAQRCSPTCVWTPCLCRVLQSWRRIPEVHGSIPIRWRCRGCIWLQCPLKLHMLKYNSHWEVLKGWELNPTMAVGGGAFGRWLGWDKIIRSGWSPRLNSRDCLRRRRMTRVHTWLARSVTCHEMCNTTSGLCQQEAHHQMQNLDHYHQNHEPS